MNQEHLSDVWTCFHTVYVNHLPIFIHNAVFFIHAISVFPSHYSCGTKRNTTAPKASWFLCPSHPSWCTATMSMRSPATYVKKRNTFDAHYHTVKKCTLKLLLKIFFFVAEIQRGPVVAERPWLLLVWYSRDGPRAQHHQAKSMWLNIHFHFRVSILQWFHGLLCGLFFTFKGELSSGCKEEPCQLLSGPGHTRIYSCDWA